MLLNLNLFVGVLLAGVVHQCSAAWYLPGVAPRNFEYGEKVDMKVNKITSIKTQLPYPYYTLPVCKPVAIEDAAENLGEILSGDRIENSDYRLEMKVKTSCNVLCKMDYTADDIKLLKNRIADEYKVHWIIDNLSLTMRSYSEDDAQERYDNGFSLGIVTTDNNNEQQYYLYNHIRFMIKYHENPESFSGARIVGFVVEPFTVKHSYEGEWSANTKLATCEKPIDHTVSPMLINDATEVVWTYDVEWVASETEWSSRWDVLLSGQPDDQIHWFSIINSLMIVLFLTGMVAMIMLRTLHRDIAKYNEEQTTEEVQEETGWKLVHGDVFRPPTFSPMLLAVFCGTGVQIMAMCVIVVFFAVLGFLSPANRGGLLTALLLLFVFMGFASGYFSARLYKMFGGKKWKRNTLMTATLYPGVIFAVFFVVNLFVWQQGSSGAVPFGTMFALLVLWFGISVPLVVAGSFYGFKKEDIKNPCRYNQIPRQIPEQVWYMNPLFSFLVGGILPFGAVFIELFFIMASIWLHQVYYVFGFLLIVMVILVATCAEITIVMCYFQLCAEDYNWWWRAFLTSGSSSLYLFLYSILYYGTKLDITKFAAAFLYFAYMWQISFTFFLLTGSIGFYACFWFVRKIYGAIKVD